GHHHRDRGHPLETAPARQGPGRVQPRHRADVQGRQRQGGVFSMSTFAALYLDEARRLLERVDGAALERLAVELAALRERGGRLFILGVGGSAGHAGHAVNDFRKLCGLEAYAPTDNVSELTARINDEGWEGCFADWLHASRLSGRDALLI